MMPVVCQSCAALWSMHKGLSAALMAAGPASGQEAETSVPGVCGPIPAREGPRSAAAGLCLRQAGSCWAVIPLR